MGKPRRPSARTVLAANVRKARLTHDWSQEELAERTGISQTYVSQIESAQRAVTIDVIERLADVFRMELGELVSSR